eukprot:COSAG01_NODE_1732_length_9368_cov_13.977452_2_plen_427_part_00
MLVYAARVLAWHEPIPPTAPPPPPPPPCGVWPYTDPCGQCIYGNMRRHNGSVLRHRIAAGETCESIGKLYGVPAFDLFNRNKSAGCCQLLSGANTSATDVLDVCAPPTLLQWRAAGHPRQPPQRNVIMTYIGSAPNGLSPPLQLPRTVNVVALGPVDDLPPPHGPAATAYQGIFRVSPTFTGNCSAHVDPTQTWRGHFAHDPDNRRVWLATMVPNYGYLTGVKDSGNWHNPSGVSLSPDEWGRNAAESLGKIILRYRLDGIDVNIERGAPSMQPGTSSAVDFGRYICAMVRYLKMQLGASLVTSFTFYSQTISRYAEVARQCGANVTLANYMTYTPDRRQVDKWITEAASHFGWSKTMFAVIDQTGHGVKPDPEIARQLLVSHPQIRGVMVWTGEYSSKCDPPWCVEEKLKHALVGMPPPPGKCTC